MSSTPLTSNLLNYLPKNKIPQTPEFLQQFTEEKNEVPIYIQTPQEYAAIYKTDLTKIDYDVVDLIDSHGNTSTSYIIKHGLPISQYTLRKRHNIDYQKFIYTIYIENDKRSYYFLKLIESKTYIRIANENEEPLQKQHFLYRSKEYIQKLLSSLQSNPKMINLLDVINSFVLLDNISLKRKVFPKRDKDITYINRKCCIKSCQDLQPKSNPNIQYISIYSWKGTKKTLKKTPFCEFHGYFCISLWIIMNFKKLVQRNIKNPNFNRNKQNKLSIYHMKHDIDMISLYHKIAIHLINIQTTLNLLKENFDLSVPSDFIIWKTN